MGTANKQWVDGEVLTAEKMNALEERINSVSDLNVSDTLYSSAFEISDDDNNIVFAVTDAGDVVTKNFNSRNINIELKFPVYPIIGYPKAYVPKVDFTGLKVFANVAELYDAYDTLVEQYPQLFRRNEILGYDESGEFEIRHYTLGMLYPKITSDRAGNNTNQWDDTKYPRKRILINGNIHGWSEQWSCYGCYLMIKEILESKDDWAMFIKNNLVLEVIPQPNPWGYNNKTSSNVNGKNLNRTYFNSIQAENRCIMNLIDDMIPKGLCGVIDFHNTGDSTPGYFVGKPTYKHWDYYAILTSQLEAITHDVYSQIHGKELTNYYHLWDATGNNGQLHEYADYMGLLGCTFEVCSNYGVKGSILSKAIGINIINSFAMYQGN